MLETVDLKARLTKSQYADALKGLNIQLAQHQRDAREAGLPTLIVFEGWDAAGKGSILSRLLQSLDPRWFAVNNVGSPNDQEKLWPPMWRFWRMLPADGRMAIYNHSWYLQVLRERVEDKPAPHELLAAYERIRVFERQLADGGAVIIKFFLHITKKEQARRFKKLEQDPAYSWKVGKDERRAH